jgi:hypothetical protein
MKRQPTKLMPEKLRGKLKWKIEGVTLNLKQGGILIAVWDPYAGHAGPAGAVSIYGEPRGKTDFYKTWSGWKNAVWRHDRMRPPKSYSV